MQLIHRQLKRYSLSFGVPFSLLAAAVLLDAQEARVVPDALIAQAAKDFGEAAAQRIQRWQALFGELKEASEANKIQRVNQFFNEEIRFANDHLHWSQEDYWATPYEALTSNGGDCEDYVIAKYHALKKLGVEGDKLRITYVKAVRLNEAHMVLTYFPTKDAIPLVLDSLINVISQADKRPDLVPVYSFNADGMWLERMKGEGIRMGNPNKLDRWTNLRVRMHQQGLDL